MRFSTYYSYQNSVSYFNDAMTRGFQLNEHIAAGQANLRPSDDPGKSALAVQYQANIAHINQFQSARNNVKTALGFEENTLSSVVSNIQSAKSSLVHASNADMMSQEDRDTMADELQSYRDTLMSLANTRDSSGDYIFSGFDSNVPAFNDAGDYQGSDKVRNIAVDDDYEMNVGHTGPDVFTDGDTNVFKALDGAIAALKNGDVSSEDLHTALDSANTAMDSILDKAGIARSNLGANLKKIDDLSSRAETDLINAKDRLYKAVGNDQESQVGLISQQNMAQFNLQASMMAFQSMNSMNLFNLIK